MAHVRALAVTIGSREAASRGYARAASYVGSTFGRLGYRVVRQRVPVPSGTSEKVPVAAGSTENVIASPRGYDPGKPHLVVGAHLDTVTPTRGANDNASGSAVLLELARLASIDGTAMPIVWVAFGGEERRRQGSSGALYGSRHYLAHLSAAERRSLKGMLNVDMVGNGAVAYVCHESLTGPAIVDALLATAKRLEIRAQKRISVGRIFSDHATFERAGIVVGWLWSGEHSTLHTPRDTIAIVQPSTIGRIGRIAWGTLRTLRL